MITEKAERINIREIIYENLPELKSMTFHLERACRSPSIMNESTMVRKSLRNYRALGIERFCILISLASSFFVLA